MARTRQDRINQECRRALTAVHYIEAAQAKGQDVARLAEKLEKATACLLRHRRCFACGEQLTDPESVRAWSVDRLGPVCRERMACREQVAS